jgi:hypothetical protein
VNVKKPRLLFSKRDDLIAPSLQRAASLQETR